MIDGLHPWYVEVLEFALNAVRIYGALLAILFVRWVQRWS